jgi:phosphatidate cytidylyltransferase
MSNLTRRIAFAVVAIPLVLAVVWLGGWALVGLVMAAAVLGMRELFDFARRQGIFPLRRTGYLSGAAIPALVYLSLTSAPALGRWSWFIAGLWVATLLTVALARRRPDQHPLAATAVTGLAVLYTAGLPSFLIAIRHLTEGGRTWTGAWLVFTPLVITWIGDTAAMLAGRTIGGPRLWPVISPMKTWSGSVAGLLGAVATVPLLNWLVLDRLGIALRPSQGLAFAAAISLAGQVGDLSKSLFKREVGLKDSSSLIPGHGGVLDRLDSLYFAVPVAAALYRGFGVI